MLKEPLEKSKKVVTTSSHQNDFMDHLEHKFNLVLVLVHNIWLFKKKKISQMQQTTMKMRHGQGFVTKNPNNVASNSKGDFFSS